MVNNVLIVSITHILEDKLNLCSLITFILHKDKS